MQVPLIDLAGSAFERGQRHGTQARGRIGRSLATYARLFAWCGLSWREARARAAAFRDPIGQLDAALLQEIEGIARGCGEPVDSILALNARTELLPPTYPGEAHPGREAALARNALDAGECTAVAVLPAAGRGALLAQNWDWLGSQREALVLLRVAAGDGPGLLTLAEAGMLAKIGLNDRGLGVCLNILRSVDDGRAPGVPVHVLLRALLGRADVAAALDCARACRFAASSNVLCADAAGGCASLELAPAGVHVVPAQGGSLCHTNHFLAPGTSALQAPLSPALSTIPRLACAQAHVQAAGGSPDLAAVQALLRDESGGLLAVCRRPDPALPAELRIETVAAVVMELAHGRMHLAADVPSQVPFVPVALHG